MLHSNLRGVPALQLRLQALAVPAACAVAAAAEGAAAGDPAAQGAV